MIKNILIINLKLMVRWIKKGTLLVYKILNKSESLNCLWVILISQYHTICCIEIRIEINYIRYFQIVKITGMDSKPSK